MSSDMTDELLTLLIRATNANTLATIAVSNKDTHGDIPGILSEVSAIDKSLKYLNRSDEEIRAEVSKKYGLTEYETHIPKRSPYATK